MIYLQSSTQSDEYPKVRNVGVTFKHSSFSSELLPENIPVNAVSLGPIETPIFDRMGLSQQEVEGFSETILSQHPMQRFGKPDQIATATVFLASDDSSYVAGVDLVVDGGMTQTSGLPILTNLKSLVLL